MSEYKKIEEQEKVLSAYGKNLVISASAGSGKTSLMIRKILDYVLNHGLKIKDLLVLTYTNSAADEMRQKLVDEITSRGDETLLKEIEDISLADISTFDSFCQKLVKRYFYVLNIDPGFNIVQGTKQTEIKNKALKSAIKIYKQKNPEEYFYLFDVYAKNRTDKNIYSLVLSLHDFCCSLLSYDQFKEMSLNLFAGKVPYATEQIFEDVKLDLTAIKVMLEKLLTMCQNLELKNSIKYINQLLSLLDSMMLQTSFESLIDFVNATDYPRDISGKELKEFKDISAKLVIAKKWFKSVFENVQKYQSGKNYLNSIDFCKKITEILLNIYEIYVFEYEKQKQRLNLMDYNDIERLTIKLLENSEILNEIKSGYKNIFVDEFQDANLVQEKIINLLKGEDNLFLVGDLKQAIYGFRQSDPQIFDNITKQYAEQEKIDGKSASMSLNCNFRTQKNILDFVNKVFNCVMTNNTASLDYTKANLQAMADYKPESSASVELNVIYQKKEEQNDILTQYSVKQNQDRLNEDSELEAYFVAERITKLLDEEIYDIKQKCYRKIKYSDICVLFRTRSKQQQFVDVFSKYNIPLLENSNQDLELTYDVGVLINLIKVSVNIKNDYVLASVMMSRLFDFDSDEMLKIRSSNADAKFFYECVKGYSQNDKIYQKISKMLQILQKFEEICRFYGLDNAILYSLKQTDYEYKIGHESNYYTRKKNIKDFVNSFNGTQFNFDAISYLNFLQNSTRQQKVASDISSYDAVTFTTMHASKGLEWPVVFCVNLGANFNREPKESELALNKDYGLGVKYYDKQSRKKFDSVFYDLISSKNKGEDFGEKLRLLYVALTRPKNRLIMVGTVQKLEFEKLAFDRQIKQSPSYLGLIVGSLSEEDISKVNNQIGEFYIDNNVNYICKVIDEEYFNLDYEQKATVMQSEESQIANELARYMQIEYKNKEATQIAQKNSVSSILKRDDIYSSYNYCPNTLKTEEYLQDVKKNELGSLYHKIFELADFEAVDTKAEINKVIKKILSSNLFEQDLIKLVDKNLIEKNIQVLKNLCGQNKVIKEHSFVMSLPYSEIESSNITDRVLVQGVCDLIIICNDHAILVDYKLSSLSKQGLLSKYKKQLYLYSKAIEYGLNLPVKSAYILDIKSGELLQNK